MKQRGTTLLAGIALVLAALALILGRYDATVSARETNDTLKELAKAQNRLADAIMAAKR